MTHESTTTRPSFCRICNALCGVLVTTRGDRVVQVRGDPDHPVSRGYTCPKGRAAAAFHHDPRRLDHPLIRSDGAGAPRELRRASWNTALDDLGSKLAAIIEEDGPDAVAGYLGTALAFDAAGYATMNAFLRGLGTLQRYTCNTLDTPCKPLVSELMTGFPGLHPVPDCDDTTLLLLVGTNPVVSHGHLTGFTSPVERLRKITRRGEVFVVDPRRTGSARHATHHLQIRPGTDAWLLGHLVREILEDGADAAYLAEHASGVESLRRAVARFDMETAVTRTGLDRSEVTALVDAVRRHRRLVAVSGTGSTMSASANVNEWLIWALQVITGSFEKPGGAWFNPGFVMALDRIPAWPAGEGLAGPGPASRPELPRRTDEYACAGLVDEIESGRIRALVVPGGNPIAAFPEAARLRHALDRLDVLVVGDVVRNEIVEAATHVWPCTGQLERSGVAGVMEFFRSELAGQWTPAMVPAVAERRPVWWCLARIADRLGLASPLPGGLDVETCSDEDVSDALAGASRDRLRAAPHGLRATRPAPWVTERVLPEGRFRLAPEMLIAELDRLEPPGSFVLIPGRQLRTLNSSLRDVAAPRERTDACRIHLAPDDAYVLDVSDGSRVVISSRHGRVGGEAVVDPSLRPGSVWIPHGWLSPNVGELASAHEDVDSLTGMVRLSGIEVRVEAAAGPAGEAITED